MTARPVALVRHDLDAAVLGLARGLAAAGLRVTVVAAGGLRPRRERQGEVEVLRVPALPDAPLRARKIGEHLAHVPAAAAALRRGRFDVVHAFSPSDGVAAAWSGAPAVLTFAEPVARERLADRRLRLATIERAVAGAAAVVAPDEAVRASLARWLGVDARLLAPGDAAGHAALYAELAGR